ncbi:hypothetical protein C484_15302 [Natrialba taiwanensis DSM 12281]|uniref:Uncharacterized protein n=1 Tax=Natrialba taiwanensis DSM 12281 TaxID=1230458 RepID=L9ZRV0_9EURY|nr:hypothetical protein [Natrialba taiwanensis]ELY88292.1 hypothetical protein C484_15302 [Natrialba taiwanensis DSM 12281]
MSSRASALESSKASGDALERGDRDLAAELEYDENGNPKKLRIDAVLSLLKGDSFENAPGRTGGDRRLAALRERRSPVQQGVDGLAGTCRRER